MSKEEDWQQDLAKFVKEKFGVNPFSPQPQPESEKKGADESAQPEFHFKFDYTPKQVKEYLDRYVIQQDMAKKVLSVAVCDHYRHVQRCHREKNCGHYSKQNVILIGPTGVGKTYLIKVIADLIGVPFVKADATKFSETGYVGGDVEDLVRDLIRKADGNLELAQYGIIYLDEIDKIASSTQFVGKDVSGQGVQRGLLKLMEETEVSTKSQFDMASQIQSMMEIGQGKKKARTINTRHILFIVSGAFENLKEVVRLRLRQTHVGFGAKLSSVVASAPTLLKEAKTEDFIQYGFEPEFVGRLPVRVTCEELSKKDLYAILKESAGSIVKQMQDAFAAYGVDLLFSDEGLLEIAEKAYHEKTGARGLITVCEKILREFKFEIPSSNIKRFVVTKQVVDHPEIELRKMLENPTYSEEAFWAEQLKQREAAK